MQNKKRYAPFLALIENISGYGGGPPGGYQ
jgi:hypothetical protein